MADNAPQTDARPVQQRPRLFISHKHADVRIADAVRSFISARSGGRVEVFQSSAAVAEGPKLGRNLNRELVEILWKTSMVVLIYTREDHDWSYCMWECGVATHPQSPDTRIVVFQCGSRVPPLFADQVRVNARIFADVQKFTNEFLTSPDFFPHYGQPITDFRPNDNNIQEASQELYDRLQKVLPPVEDDTINEWCPYPFLRLEMSSDQVTRIRKELSERRLQTTFDTIRDCFVADGDTEAKRIFGMAQVPINTQLNVLIDRWRERFPDAELKWVEAIAKQVLPAVQGQFPTLYWELMRGVDEKDGTWYAPVVNRVRAIAGSQAMQFDIYFDKFALDEEEKRVKVGIPI